MGWARLPILFPSSLFLKPALPPKVAAVSFGSSHVLSLLMLRDLASLALPSGVVIDAGFWETSILPVYDGRPLITSARFLPLAGAALDLRLRDLLVEHGTVTTQEGPAATTCRVSELPEATRLAMLNFETLELLKVKIAAVAPATALAAPKDETRVLANLPGGRTLSFPRWLGEEVCEALFQKDDEDDRSLPVALAETLLWVNSDLRTPLASTVLLIGGTAMLPGFASRLIDSTVALIQADARYETLRSLTPKLKVAEHPFKPNLLAWTGGSALGALKVHGQEVTREQYASSDKIAPDWPSRKDK